MGMSESMPRRRAGVAVNYALLLLALLLSFSGHWSGWSNMTRIGFWVAAALVVVTFFPVHVRAGWWRLVHADPAALDERELQQNLEAVRRAYVIFAIVSLLVILTLVIFGLGGQTQQLVVFWVLLYLAHTLPSSILAWKLSRTPLQTDD
jgi:hypothetical protein